MKKKYISYLLAVTVSSSFAQTTVVSAIEKNDGVIVTDDVSSNNEEANNKLDTTNNEASVNEENVTEENTSVDEENIPEEDTSVDEENTIEEDTSVDEENTTEEDASVNEENITNEDALLDEKAINENVSATTDITSNEEVLTQENTQEMIEINNIDELRNINDNLSGNYVLAKDINLNGQDVVIGSKDNPFTGTFDGMSRTISGLTSNGGIDIGNGLFVATDGATIKNLKLKSPNVVGNYYTGALVGIAKNTNIESITIEDPIVRSQGITTGVSLLDSATTYAGGVIGWSENTNINNVHVLRPNILNTTDVAIDGLKYPTYYAGGITGRNIGGSIFYAQVLEGTIKASHQSTIGLISVTKMVAGGITGLAQGHIENAYVTSTIDTYGRLDVPLGGVEPTSGGIAGYYDEGASIKSAVFKGIVNTETRYMGIGTHDKWTGGIVGYQMGGDLSDIQGAYYHNEISKPDKAPKEFGAVWDKSNTEQYGPITDENFGDTSLFLGFDFDGYWHVDKDTGHVMYGPGVGDGSEDDEIMPSHTPIIEGVEDIVIVKGDSFDPKDGITAWDAEDGDITRYIEIIGEVDVNVVGEYTLTYRTMDRDHNLTSVTRLITVVNSIVTGDDTDGDGKPDINLDIDGDGIPDINIDTDGDGIPDLNVDTNGDGKPNVNVDTNGDGKADINISEIPNEWKPELDADINNNGEVDYDTDANYPKPSINVDIDGDGKPDINIDTNGDEIPDINIDIDGDGKPDINIDTNGDGIPDINIDIDGDGKPDINIDTDGDGIPDINIDIDGDQVADVNIDTDGDMIPDINVDTAGDGIPDINIDTDKNGVPDINVDTTGDGQADTNIDINGDGIADENIVTPPTEWNPGVNVDTNGDGKPNYDTDTNYKPSTPVDPTGKSLVKAAYWKNDWMVIDGYHSVDGVELSNENGDKVVRRAEIIDENGNALATAKVTSVNWETVSYSEDLTGYQIMITKDEFAKLTENKAYKIKLITEYKDETYETIVKQKESSKFRVTDWIDGYYREFDKLGTNVIDSMVISTDVNEQSELIIRRNLNDDVDLNITRSNINAKNQLVIDGEIESSFDFNKNHKKFIVIKDNSGTEVYRKEIPSFKDRKNSFQAIISQEFVGENFVYGVQVTTGETIVINKGIN